MLRNSLISLFLLILNFAANAANVFGVCTVTCTWDASSTAMWSASSGGATGAAVPGSGDAVIFDAATCVGGVTCTITVNTTVTVQSITMGACTASTTGCILDFSVNNNNVTLSLAGASAFSGSGTGTRNLKMGNGTWTLTSTTANWTMTTTTNLTFSAGSSTISFTGANTTTSSRLFNGGGLTYNVVSFGASGSNMGTTQIAGANTYATLNLTAPLHAVFNNATHTITNAFTWTGTSSNPLLIRTSSVTNPAVISTANNSTLAWAGIAGITFQGGGTFSASNSMDYGNNTGITITVPNVVATGGKIIGG